MTETLDARATMDAELRGGLPDAIGEYAQHDPELFTAYLSWRAAMLADGAIEHKTKLLMVVSILAAMKDLEPLRLYSRIARAEGASADELKEALRVGVLFSGGAGVAAAAGVAELLVAG
jgi:4-carboxymuconolactone decarboxylase